MPGSRKPWLREVDSASPAIFKDVMAGHSELEVTEHLLNVLALALFRRVFSTFHL
jgi:hypothetical protein